MIKPDILPCFLLEISTSKVLQIIGNGLNLNYRTHFASGMQAFICFSKYSFPLHLNTCI